MSLARGDQVAVRAGAKLEELPLTPEEFFVLSRVDGKAAVGEVLCTTGLGEETTERILVKLLSLGALEVVSSTAAGHKTAQSTTSERSTARVRPGGPKRDAAKRRHETPPSGPNVVPVAADDPRIDPDLEITIDEQRHLLALADRLRALGPFEVLGLVPTDNDKHIRRAYFEASRQFHPDRYYGRRIGRFKEVLDQLFKRASSAHELLMDPLKRRPYVEHHLGEVRRAEELEAARRQAEQEAVLQRQQLEEARAREERRQRDEERERRKRSRHAAEMKQKARMRYEEGLAALEGKRFAAAANSFRIALQLDGTEPEYRERWQFALGVARHERATKTFSRATGLMAIGHYAEAAQLFLEAAEADPTATHLAHAANAIRDQDPARGRALALQALDALNVAQIKGEARSTGELAQLHVLIARAFEAAGQTKSAGEQAKLALSLAPQDEEVRALLKSLKLT